MATPGLLYVKMQPKPDLPEAQFHEWYNNEHGPTRLRFAHIFPNGFRYRATDNKEPTYLAVYDVTDTALLETKEYTDLRAHRSAHEAATIGQVDVRRDIYDLVHERSNEAFRPLESLTDADAEGTQLVVNETTVKNDYRQAEEEYTTWYEEEHVDMLSRVPGWLRTRLFRTSPIGNPSRTTLLSVTEYARENGLGGPEHKAAMDTPWRTKVTAGCVDAKERRTYSLFYVFGPAPRDLAHLAHLPSSGRAFSYGVAGPRDETTTTTTTTLAGDRHPGISSYITTKSDGLNIRYRLEGNPSPAAPTVAFCNSLLTSLHMWDPLVQILKTERPDLRILRYDARGRHAVPKPPRPATLDVLAADLDEVLDALRIERLDALVGVSMGGATTLSFALRYPGRVGRFVACDFNAASSAANTQAWKDRIEVAEADGGTGIKTLATQTVGRWFHPSTVEGKETLVNLMTEMVAANDVEGFRYSCQALWDYDLKPRIGECSVPGLLVVGEGDGKGALVKAMQGFAGALGAEGTRLAIVPETGHLPMWEDADAFWEAVREFL
ncbi:3-oxoadipate enol-lactonase [Sodiomyces alkalinus F11]|uniref:3-oxoadipate enol-lactonase n=1 Tax=Sodiomyces alkalinus (strain CBS 110278 / VKM F-3762 / F11) TaxID=1314773 RepID=A0A3N2PL58_SODAK|nr:3-oxoadipate enol-lactonase [Sodiomyces alkalinus F11]ROT35066.1 3-oxoadipate enol-lactonase [Sodiomyces alkalinus F11]